MWVIRLAIYTPTHTWAVSIMEQDIITTPGMEPITIQGQSLTVTVFTGIPTPDGVSRLGSPTAG